MIDKNDKWEVVWLLGLPALFTEERISDDEVPAGLYKYDLREADDPDVFYYATLEEYVRVNHAGTILVTKQIDLGPDGYIDFDRRPEDDRPGFNGTYMTVEDYLRYSEISSDKKSNVRYWDMLDDLTGEFIEKFAKEGFFGEELDEPSVIDLAAAVRDVAIQKLTEWHHFEFPYVEGEF